MGDMAVDQLKKGTKDSAAVIFALIEKRIHWMDERGISHWNDDDYLSLYPLDYFIRQAAAGHLWLLEDESAAAVLLTRDDRWADRPARGAVYVHNLAGDPGVKGAGRRFLRALEDAARAEGVEAIRLDCSVGNEGLKRFYTGLGFAPAGDVQDGDYRGILMEKIL